MRELKENNGLHAGKRYRITDYETTTAQANTQSKNHAFDIILVANDSHTFNEQACVVQHEGTEYFNNSNLGKWQIWYCLDNDTNRFEWASESGKGVIYRLIDEFNNDLPYDFKNIQFKDAQDNWRYTFDSGEEEEDLSMDGFANQICNNIVKSSVDNAKQQLNNIVFQGENCNGNVFGCNCKNIIFGSNSKNNKFGNGCEGIYCGSFT